MNSFWYKKANQAEYKNTSVSATVTAESSESPMHLLRIMFYGTWWR